MSDTFTLKGKLKIQPPLATANTSGLTITEADISESLAVNAKLDTMYTLAADGAEVVSFGDLAGATYIILLPNQKVKATLTSPDGAAQLIPVGGFTVINADGAPFTALSLTRQAGVLTTVRVILVEKGS